MANKTATSTPFKITTTKEKTELYGLTKTEYQRDDNGVLTNPKVSYYIETTQIDFQTIPENLRDLNQGGPGGTKYLKKVAEYDPTTKKFTGTSETGADLQSEIGLFNNGKENQLKTVTAAANTSITKQENIEANSANNQLFKSNQAPTDPNTPTTSTTSTESFTEKDVKDELKGSKKRTEESYTKLLKYPLNLKSEAQDCIKFSMIEYLQSGISPTESQLDRRVSINGEGNPIIGKREILTTIVLPIPGGINDSNGVDWQADAMDSISQGIGNIVMQSITGGGKGASQSIGEAGEAARGNIEGLKAVVSSRFTNALTNSSKAMQRAYGAAINPNLELLFNGPQLRTFSFTFRLSPRSEAEAKTIKQIIRYFKQGMTPKRSSGYLLLQSPHTFAISYVSGNKQHPYLNKFKECALTQCNVNYAPDGTYMTFDGAEKSMTAYDLTLQFQELSPLYDDDYGNDNNNIGF